MKTKEELEKSNDQELINLYFHTNYPPILIEVIVERLKINSKFMDAFRNYGDQNGFDLHDYLIMEAKGIKTWI